MTDTRSYIDRAEAEDHGFHGAIVFEPGPPEFTLGEQVQYVIPLLDDAIEAILGVLEDPDGLLEGSGALVRHVKLRSIEELAARRDTLKRLIEAAVSINQR